MKRIVRRNPALTKLLPGVVAEAELGAPVAVQFHVVEALRGAVPGSGVGVRRVEAGAEDVAEVPHTNNMPAILILTTIIPCVESKQSSFFYNFSTVNTFNPVLWPGHCLP